MYDITKLAYKTFSLFSYWVNYHLTVSMGQWDLYYTGNPQVLVQYSFNNEDLQNVVYVYTSTYTYAYFAFII